MDFGGRHYNEMKWTENEEGTPLKENLIIIHGGGPTAVLNCSLYGAVREALSLIHI